MLLSQAEKKVASMARELDALTAFERRRLFRRPGGMVGEGRVQVGLWCSKLGVLVESG